MINSNQHMTITKKELQLMPDYIKIGIAKMLQKNDGRLTIIDDEKAE
jgi:hypothetical protein